MFIAISIGSALYVTVASLNYLRLYPALDEIQNHMTYQVYTLTLVKGPASAQSALVADVRVGNPSDYSGFRLTSVSLTLFFYSLSNRSVALFNNPISLNGSQTIDMVLGPNSLDSVTVNVELSSSQSNMLQSFIGQNPGLVMAEVQLRVDITTFLVPVTGTVPFTRTQDIQLSLS